MKVVWKYEFNPNAVVKDIYWCSISAPEGAKPISAAVISGKCFVWMEVDPNKPHKDIRIYSVGTGWGIVPPNCRFLATLIQRSYVWHIYVE